MAARDALSQWRSMSQNAAGRWLFSRIVCFRAPYFASIRPTLLKLEPGVAMARIQHRRAVQNHIGTVHAIACVNLAELVAGVGTEVSIPKGMRWLPKGMSVKYLAKAIGPLTATATVPDVKGADPQDLVVAVAVRDADDRVVVSADITMWVTSKPLG